MRVAVDVCIGTDGVHLLRWAGHEVVTVARPGESDCSWFKRALKARVEVVISADSGLAALAYDARVELHQPLHGDSEIVTVTRFLEIAAMQARLREQPEPLIGGP